ncbi:hypothetical protein N665_1026s0022 [Sinapis alba]|nr:hypothetical protein N665_1026s0022 [Sinapis alba]
MEHPTSSSSLILTTQPPPQLTPTASDCFNGSEPRVILESDVPGPQSLNPLTITSLPPGTQPLSQFVSSDPTGMEKAPNQNTSSLVSSLPQVTMALEINSSALVSSTVAPPEPARFVPSLGSWVKPLLFEPPATPPESSTPLGYDPAIVGNQLAALWPSLNDEILNKPLKNKHPSRSFQPPIEKLPPPELKEDGSLRFPWAARLSPQSRNLYRAATPTYRLDGTPEVSIPSKVLRLGPENKDEYIIGKFHRCSLPPGGLVHAVVNRIWGRNCKITCKKLGDSSFMFHIPHQPTRQWIIQRGVWHIDDCLLFVLPWTPEGSFEIPEISTLPVWVNLKNIPDCCYSRLGISHVASGLGEPILTHKPRLDPTSMGEAKVLVEMELDRDFPKLIALDDKQGSIFLVNVDYTWIPSTCERCGNLGHKEKRCLLSSKPTHDSNLHQREGDGISNEIPVVDIDLILQQKEKDTSSSLALQQKGLSVNSTSPTSTSAHDPFLLQNQIKELEVSSMVSDSEICSNLKSGPETDPLINVSADVSIDYQDIPDTRYTTHSLSLQLQQGNQTPLPHLSNTLSPLSPSRFTVLGDVDEVETKQRNSLSLTRGVRETKPPVKYQDLEWKTVRGRRKHGHRGRGSSH